MRGVDEVAPDVIGEAMADACSDGGDRAQGTIPEKVRHADLDTHRFESKTGFAYLNAIFFRRHRRILVRPILACLAIIAILFAAAVVASVYQPNIKSLVSRPDAILPMLITFGWQWAFVIYLVAVPILIAFVTFVPDRPASTGTIDVEVKGDSGHVINAAVVGLAVFAGLACMEPS